MVAEVIRDRLNAPEFHPFTLVLVNGERLTVRHRDSMAYPSTMVGDRRVFLPYVAVVQADGDPVVTRSISVLLIAEAVDG